MKWEMKPNFHWILYLIRVIYLINYRHLAPYDDTCHVRMHDGIHKDQLRIGLPPIHYRELILGVHPANERRCYKVTPSLIGWVQT